MAGQGGQTLQLVKAPPHRVWGAARSHLSPRLGDVWAHCGWILPRYTRRLYPPFRQTASGTQNQRLRQAILRFWNIFQFANIYSNTLVKIHPTSLYSLYSKKRRVRILKHQKCFNNFFPPVFRRWTQSCCFTQYRRRQLLNPFSPGDSQVTESKKLENLALLLLG